MADGNGSEGGGASPLWYAVGAFVIIGLMMGTIVLLKPLEFKPVPAVHCEEAACSHEGTAPGPEGVSHETAPPASGPEGTSHESAPPPHPE
ncbi:MAG TPA: hypothetical protein VII56_08045 [Rhizomicrobium sp.]